MTAKRMHVGGESPCQKAPRAGGPSQKAPRTGGPCQKAPRIGGSERMLHKTAERMYGGGKSLCQKEPRTEESERLVAQQKRMHMGGKSPRTEDSERVLAQKKIQKKTSEWKYSSDSNVSKDHSYFIGYEGCLAKVLLTMGVFKKMGLVDIKKKLDHTMLTSGKVIRIENGLSAGYSLGVIGSTWHISVVLYAMQDTRYQLIKMDITNGACKALKGKSRNTFLLDGILNSEYICNHKREYHYHPGTGERYVKKDCLKTDWRHTVAMADQKLFCSALDAEGQSANLLGLNKSGRPHKGNGYLSEFFNVYMLMPRYKVDEEDGGESEDDDDDEDESEDDDDDEDESEDDDADDEDDDDVNAIDNTREVEDKVDDARDDRIGEDGTNDGDEKDTSEYKDGDNEEEGRDDNGGEEETGDGEDVGEEKDKYEYKDSDREEECGDGEGGDDDIGDGDGRRWNLVSVRCRRRPALHGHVQGLCRAYGITRNLLENDVGYAVTRSYKMDNAHAWARYCESEYYRPLYTHPPIDRWMPGVYTCQLLGGKPVRYYKIELTDAHWYQQLTSNQKRLTVCDFHTCVSIGAGEVFELTGIRDDTHWVGGLPGTNTENYFAFVVRGDEDVFDQNKRTTREIRAWQAMQIEHFGDTPDDHSQAMYA
jgi:hypothetical protein